jgi:hypothetical protein
LKNAGYGSFSVFWNTLKIGVDFFSSVIIDNTKFHRLQAFLQQWVSTNVLYLQKIAFELNYCLFNICVIKDPL